MTRTHHSDGINGIKNGVQQDIVQWWFFLGWRLCTGRISIRRSRGISSISDVKYSIDGFVPRYFLAGGEVEEHRPVKDVYLILLGAAHTVYGILKSLEFYQRLSYLRHHCQVAKMQQKNTCAMRIK